jgi:hypothetical protein
LVTIKVDFFVWETISAFRAIQRYFELVEAQIAKVKDEEWEKLEQLPVPSDEEEYQTEYLVAIDAHKREFGKVLPRLVSYSFVMMLFSELEYRINDICRELKKRENLPLKINDFRGDLTERFSKFLTMGNKPQLEKNEKAAINGFVVVRNCIVHNNGYLSNFAESEKLRSLAKTELHLKVVGKGEGARIQVTIGYLNSRVEYFIGMFRRLFGVLNFGPEIPIISSSNQS